MKKVIVTLTILVFSTYLFSCENETVTDIDSLYQTRSTEGDDGQVKPPPPPPPPAGVGS